jgi:hypothetical protein
MGVYFPPSPGYGRLIFPSFLKVVTAILCVLCAVSIYRGLSKHSLVCLSLFYFVCETKFSSQNDWLSNLFYTSTKLSILKLLLYLSSVLVFFSIYQPNLQAIILLSVDKIVWLSEFFSICQPSVKVLVFFSICQPNSGTILLFLNLSN